MIPLKIFAYFEFDGSTQKNLGQEHQKAGKVSGTKKKQRNML